MPPSLPQAQLSALHDAIRAEMRQNTKDLIADNRESLQPIKNDLRDVNTKLDAIMSGEVLVTRGQFLRLVDKLKAHGIAVDERELFTH